MGTTPHYLYSVGRFLVNDGDVGPVEQFDQVNHGAGLIGVGGDGAGKVLEAVLVAQLAAGGEEADLGNLEEAQEVGHLDGSDAAGRAHHPGNDLVGHYGGASVGTLVLTVQCRD